MLGQSPDRQHVLSRSAQLLYCTCMLPLKKHLAQAGARPQVEALPQAEAARDFPRPVRLTPATSGYLDAIRALASLAVMFGLCRGFYFVDYGYVEHVKAPSLAKLTD